MGIYDRDYYRQERSGFSLGAPRSAVVTLILINVAVFLVDALLFSDDHRLTNVLSARVGTLTHPWLWWQFVTYGFAHDPTSLQHIFFNMLALWFLGRDVEDLYGPKEFIRLYLAMIVVGGIAWSVAGKLGGLPDTYNLGPRSLDIRVLGASGAVTGVVVLYALNFPRRMMLFMFVLPMPAWVLGFLVVLMDIWGAMYAPDAHVAYVVHLAGAAFAFVYYQQRWNFGRLMAGRFHWPRFPRRPQLRVHDPAEQDDDEVPEEEVDRILEKIHREGEGSLTRKERRILETASREYQRRRRPE